MSKLKVSAQEGRVLVMVLIILCLGALLIPTFLSHSSANLLATQAAEEGMKEQYAADAGVEYALGHFLHGATPTPSLSLPPECAGGWDCWEKEFPINNNTVTVTIEFVREDDDGTVYEVTSTATSDEGGGTTLKSLVFVSDVGDVSFIAGDFTWTGGKPFRGSVYAAGDIVLGDNAHIQTLKGRGGNAYADGNIDLGEHAQIHGDACASGDIDLGEHAQIHGDVSAGGDIELGEQVQIHGGACAGGDIWLGTQVQIHGDVYVTGDNANITLGVSAQIHGDVYVTGDNANITLGEQAKIHGSVYVTGDSVNITLGESAEIKGEGDPDYTGVYATGAINGECAQVEGGCHPYYSGGYPDPPECPELPGLKILVY